MITPFEWVEALTWADKFELETVAGKKPVIDTEYTEILRKIHTAPLVVSMTPTVNPITCNLILYTFAQKFVGVWEDIIKLRRSIESTLAQNSESPAFAKLIASFMAPQYILLTTLPSGIYIGNPEDIYNQRHNCGKIWYPVDGLGKRICEFDYNGQPTAQWLRDAENRR